MNPKKLFDAYTKNVRVYLEHTGRPDEKLMRQVENAIDICEQGCDDFRRSIMAYFGLLYMRKKPITWDCNPELKKALLIVCGQEEEHLRAIAAAYLSAKP